jgi:prepilin-type N-terminal cleavage/methylation domain-containing protein
MEVLKKAKKNRKGFTLVELIVVIGILLILAVLATIAYTNIVQEAQRASRRSDAAAVAQALNVYNSMVLNDSSRIVNSFAAGLGDGRINTNGTFDLRVTTSASATAPVHRGILETDLSLSISATRYTEIVPSATDPGPRVRWNNGRWDVQE